MSEKQKIITFGVLESLYNKINDVALAKDQKVSVYMKKFVDDYFTDDKNVVRIMRSVKTRAHVGIRLNFGIHAK